MTRARHVEHQTSPPLDAGTSNKFLTHSVFHGRLPLSANGSSRATPAKPSSAIDLDRYFLNQPPAPPSPPGFRRPATRSSPPQVSWYTNDTIALSYLGLPRNWVAYDTVITAVLPPGAPTPLLSYEPTYGAGADAVDQSCRAGGRGRAGWEGLRNIMAWMEMEVALHFTCH